MSERPTTSASSSQDVDKYDVIIVGAGPAGASAAIYTARADLKTLVIDKGLTVGALGVTGNISNYPGVPGPISGAELLAIIRQQAESFGATFLTDRVVSADVRSSTKTVITNGGTYEARAVVIATGAMGRATTVEGEERLLGKGVSYCATCDGAFFRGRPVAVVGNNDEALEESLFLTKFASSVALIVPTSSFKASDALVTEIERAPKVTTHFSARLSSVLGESGVTGIRIMPRQTPEMEVVVDGVFIYLQGSRPITDFLLGQLETTPQGCLKVNEHMQTSASGVFAIGDLLCTHVKQAVIAAADGVMAAIEVEKHLNNRAKAKIDWG